MAHCGSAQWWMAGKNENRRNERGTEGGGSLDQGQKNKMHIMVNG